MALRTPWILACVALLGCAHTQPVPLAALTLPGTDGAQHPFGELVRGAPATVLMFFSSHCPCVDAHDAQLVTLAGEMRGAGVRFYAVDSEFGATVEEDRVEATRRAYPFPILIDPNAQLAAAVDAHYALYTVIFDGSGALRYSGGFDSSKGPPAADTEPWVRLALADLLAGRPVSHDHPKALGCALRRW